VADWTHYRKCPSCGAAIGEPCTRLDGTIETNGVPDPRRVARDIPHGRRPLRTGYAREGGR